MNDIKITNQSFIRADADNQHLKTGDWFCSAFRTKHKFFHFVKIKEVLKDGFVCEDTGITYPFDDVLYRAELVLDRAELVLETEKTATKPLTAIQLQAQIDALENLEFNPRENVTDLAMSIKNKAESLRRQLHDLRQATSSELASKVESLELFIVMNEQGKFFRAKGYGGYGDTWTDSIKKAKSYGSIGQARSRVTWFANNYPAYPAPVIVKFFIGSFEILDEKERVKKAIKSKEQKALESQQRLAKHKVKMAEMELKNAQDKLKKLKG